MKVSQLINQANASEVARLYQEIYSTTDGWGSVESFDEFRDRLNKTVGILEGEDQFKVIVEWIDQKWGGPNNDKFHDQYMSVGGRKVKDPDQIWSLSMTDWGAWKEMEVDDESGKNLSLDELAMHVYYEMTWWGWPETQEEHRDRLTDLAEQVDRDFADYKDGDPLPPGYVDGKEFLDRLQKDED